MTRPLRLTDILALSLAPSRGFLNWAVSFRHLEAGAPRPSSPWSLAPLALSYQRRRLTWVQAHGRQVQGVASAISGRGRGTWHLELLLAPQDEAGLTELLANPPRPHTRKVAEKLLLRLPEESLALKAALKAGFTPFLSEVLYQWDGHLPEESPQVLTLREKSAADDYGIFRLFCSAMSPAYIAAAGPTFEFWRDSLENSREGAREIVFEQDGSIKGWLRIHSHRRTSLLEALTSKECEGELGHLLSFALRQEGVGDKVLCLYPSVPGPCQGQLARLGFRSRQVFIRLVKPLAVRVPEPGWAAVRA